MIYLKALVIFYVPLDATILLHDVERLSLEQVKGIGWVPLVEEEDKGCRGSPVGPVGQKERRKWKDKRSRIS